jgi:hypothetical protein
VVSERGRTCRKVDRRRGAAYDEIDVELAHDKVVVRVRGRVIRALTGADADAVRAAMDDPKKLQRVVASKTGKPE